MMSYIVINDILDELREENKRLNEENKLIYDLLEKYRMFSFNFQKTCICCQNSNNDSIIESLEEEYEIIAIKRIKTEVIEEDNDSSTNLLGSELLQKSLEDNQIIDGNETKYNIDDITNEYINKGLNIKIKDIERNEEMTPKSIKSIKSKNKIRKSKQMASKKIRRDLRNKIRKSQERASIRNRRNSKNNIRKPVIIKRPAVRKCRFCRKRIINISESYIIKATEGWYHRSCHETKELERIKICSLCDKECQDLPLHKGRVKREGQWYHKECKYKEFIEQQICKFCGKSCVEYEIDGKTPNLSSKPYHEICYQNSVPKESKDNIVVKSGGMDCIYCKRNVRRSRKEDKSRNNSGQWYHRKCASRARSKRRHQIVDSVELCIFCWKDCSYCSKTQKHRNKEGQSYHYKCFRDNFQLKSAENLKTNDKELKDCSETNMSETVSDTNFEANINSKESEDNEQTDDEEYIPNKEKPKKRKPKTRHVCTYDGCKEGFKTKSLKDLHIRRVHTFEKPYKCNECGKCFNVMSGLTTHKKIHSFYRNPKLTVKCDIKDCNKYFRSKEYMKSHKRITHSDVRYVCDWPECGHVFKKLDSFEGHQRRHSGFREFKCDYEGCHKAFYTKKYLANHKMTHFKSFVCLWPGCDERFSTKDILSSHMNKHQNIRPFKCTFDGCGKDFYGQSQLFHHNWSFHRNK